MNAGQNCTVQPLKTRQHIEAIKRVLGDSPRDLALFSVGVNAGLRGSDLLGLRWSNVLTDEGTIRRVLEVNEGKTGNLRRIAISDAMRVALCAWAMASCEAMGEGSSHGMAGGMAETGRGTFPIKSKRHGIQKNPRQKKQGFPEINQKNFLFPNANGKAMTIQRLHQLVNEWTQRAGIEGHFGSHTLRKTYGLHLRKHGVELPVLMRIFGHSNQAITLRYLGISDDEIDEANLRLNL